MWRLIGITLPHYEDSVKEKQIITSLLQSNTIEYFHIRKPEFDKKQMLHWFEDLPLEIRKRLSVHDCTELAKELQIGGVHLNQRNNYEIPIGFQGRISRSCHTLAEVRQWKTKCDYVFLSPIYDSISKEGYESRFSKTELKKAVEQGVIDRNVFALSGVNFERLAELKEIGFTSAAMLGCLWQEKER